MITKLLVIYIYSIVCIIILKYKKTRQFIFEGYIVLFESRAINCQYFRCGQIVVRKTIFIISHKILNFCWNAF